MSHPFGILQRLRASLLARLFPGRYKGHHELLYWQLRQRDEGVLNGAHFETFYTSAFGLTTAQYRGKRILDVGCGPRGSLEWADAASTRVGLDPLAHSYRRLGTGRHRMLYVAAQAEAMPFRDGIFDVVASFNSLDHVDEIEGTISEMIRVLRPGGTLLLFTEVNHAPRPTEPQSFSWDILDRFAPTLRVVDSKRFKLGEDGLYNSIALAAPYVDDGSRRPGILLAKLERAASANPVVGRQEN